MSQLPKNFHTTHITLKISHISKITLARLLQGGSTDRKLIVITLTSFDPFPFQFTDVSSILKGVMWRALWKKAIIRKGFKFFAFKINFRDGAIVGDKRNKKFNVKDKDRMHFITED